MHRDRTEAQDDTQDEEKVLREARQRLDQCVSAWSTNHDLAEIDIQMRSGEQWDDAVKRQREEDHRPTLTFNRLETYIQQVVGEQRKNRPTIHVAPAELDLEEKVPGSQQDQTGEPVQYNKSTVLEGIVRQIEYRSRADAARDTAFDHAVGNGFGFYRLVTEYANEHSFDQEIKVKRIRNPFSVYLDPAAETVTGEDATFGFISDWLTKDEFKNLYPDHEPAEDLPRGDGENQAMWWAEGKVRVVEYFRKVPIERRIALVQTPEGSRTITLGQTSSVEREREQIRSVGGQIQRERVVKDSKVEWRLINGSSTLEGPQEFPSKYIPIIPVYGREIIDDGEVIYQSLIRHALDAQKNYNYWRSAMTELVALAPKAPFVGPASAFAGYEDRWETANIRNWSFLPYDDSAPAPPQRQPNSDVPQGATQEAQSADYDMDACIGMFEASRGEASNERTGAAIQARQKGAEAGTYIFVDNLTRAIEHEGRVILDMMPRVYDTERVVRIRQQDGEGDFVRINTKAPDGQPKGDIRSGKWDVAVRAGPSHQTQREEFVSSLWEASKANPDLWKVAGDLLVQNMDWPGADKIANRLRKTMPPQILADEPGEMPEQQPSPDQQVQMEEMKARQMEAEAKKAQAEATQQKADADIQQEALQTEQDNYEKQTEVMQMLTNLAKLEQELNKMDVDAEVQNAVSDAVTQLQSAGFLQASAGQSARDDSSESTQL